MTIGCIKQENRTCLKQRAYRVKKGCYKDFFSLYNNPKNDPQGEQMFIFYQKII